MTDSVHTPIQHKLLLLKEYTPGLSGQYMYGETKSYIQTRRVLPGRCRESLYDKRRKGRSAEHWGWRD